MPRSALHVTLEPMAPLPQIKCAGKDKPSLSNADELRWRC
jgi:hypothetical protein